MKAKASAPGKVILFGEHAVVYGITAIATALSDLRIDASIESQSTPILRLVLDDIKEENGAPFSMELSMDRVHQIVKHADSDDPMKPCNPNEETLTRLKEEFAAYPVQASQGTMAVLYLVAKMLPELTADAADLRKAPALKDLRGIQLTVKSVSLPIGAGLGSSAAFSVAVAGGLVLLRKKMAAIATANGECNDSKCILGSEAGTMPSKAELEVINGWAYAAEVVIHGSPSGLDNTTSCYGGAVKYDKSSGKFETLPPLPPLSILLSNTKVPRSTKVLVAGVRKLFDVYPAVIQPILDSIGGISKRFLELTALYTTLTSSKESNSSESADWMRRFETEMSDLVRLNHGLLGALGVSHPALNQIVESSEKFGFAGKLTGAGGGGCAITMLKADAEDETRLLTDSLAGLGFDVFQSTVGGSGVLWYT
jgi:mevalonate kinase